MTHIDGTTGGFRTRLDADTTAMVDTIAALGGVESRTAALHRIVAEHHAGLMRATGRSADELARLAKNSTAAASSPAGAVDGGQGATRPPAPTIDRAAVRGDLLADLAEAEERLARGEWLDGDVVVVAHEIPWTRPVPAHVHLDGGSCVYGDRCGR